MLRALMLRARAPAHTLNLAFWGRSGDRWKVSTDSGAKGGMQYVHTSHRCIDTHTYTRLQHAPCRSVCHVAMPFHAIRVEHRMYVVLPGTTDGSNDGNDDNEDDDDGDWGRFSQLFCLHRKRFVLCRLFPVCLFSPGMPGTVEGKSIQTRIS